MSEQTIEDLLVTAAQRLSMRMTDEDASAVVRRVYEEQLRLLQERATVATSARPTPRPSFRLAARLLPAGERTRRIGEWIDHVECVREDGGGARRATASILLRVPRVAFGARLNRLRRAISRTT